MIPYPFSPSIYNEFLRSRIQKLRFSPDDEMDMFADTKDPPMRWGLM